MDHTVISVLVAVISFLFLVVLAGLAKIITDFEKVKDACLKFKKWQKERKEYKKMVRDRKRALELAVYCPNIDKLDELLSEMKSFNAKIDSIEAKLDNHIKKDVVDFADRIWYLAEKYRRLGYFSLVERKILAARAFEYFKSGGNSDAGESFKHSMTLPYIKGGEKVIFDFNLFMELGPVKYFEHS